MQYVNPADGFRLQIIDLRPLPEVRRQEECDRLIAEEARKPFNLNCGPVFRALSCVSRGGSKSSFSMSIILSPDAPR